MTASNPADNELLSQHLDGSDTLRGLSEADQELVTDWKQLGTDIRQIPMLSVDLVAAVSSQLHNVSVAARPKVSRSRSSVAFVAASMTVLSCCLVMWFLPPHPTSDNGLTTAASTFTSQQLASGFAQCDIVVITRPDGTERTSDWLQTSFDAHGMQSQAILVDSNSTATQEARLVVADAEPKRLLNFMNAYESELNPSQIDEMDPDELLSKFVESMETPSLAEEHFNEFVVVVPKKLLEEMNLRRSAKSTVPTASSGIAVANKNTAAGPQQTDPIRPVLFVIRRRKAATASPVIDGAGIPKPTQTAAGTA